MKSPPHPGHSIRDACLDPLGLTVAEGSKVLGISRSTLYRLMNGRSNISPEIAVRLSKAFGSTPETWLKMQLAYDLAQVQAKIRTIKVQSQFPAEERPRI